MLLVQVPTSHGKADLGIYRDASAKILTVLGSKFPSCIIERASIDEVYIDVSIEAEKLLEQQSSSNPSFLSSALEEVISIPSLIAGDDSTEVTMSRRDISKGHSGTETLAASYQQGELRDEQAQQAASSWFLRPAQQWSTDDKLLLCGALVINKLRKAVYDELGFTCSGGIANNKILAKLSSAMHKPNKQTMAPPCVVPGLMRDLPFNRIQGLGGKLGATIEAVYGEKVRTMGQILAVPQEELTRHFSVETAQWLHAVAQGIDREPVLDRALPVSIGCSKSFRSTSRLTPAHLADGTVLHWLTELARELQERVAADTKTNSRIPRNLQAGASVKVYDDNTSTTSSSNAASAATSSDLPGESAADGPHVPDEWAGWFAERGFSLSKICPLPASSTAESVARAALAMLTKAIYQHPKFLAATSSRDGAVSGLLGSARDVSMTTTAAAVPSSPMRTTDAQSNSNIVFKAAEEGAVVWAITGLSLGATNFQQVEVGAGSIRSYFSKPALPPDSDSNYKKEQSTAAPEKAMTELEASIAPASPISTLQAAPAKKRTIGEAFAAGAKSKPNHTVLTASEWRAGASSAAGQDSSGGSDVGIAPPEEGVCCEVNAASDCIMSEAIELEGGTCEERSRCGGEGRELLSSPVAQSSSRGAGTGILHWLAKPTTTVSSQQQEQHQPRSMRDVDSAVFLSLPAALQREIELTMRLRQHSQPPLSTASNAALVTQTQLSTTATTVPTTATATTTTAAAARGWMEQQPSSMQEVDSAVFLTLPPDIQREVELTMKHRQQQKTKRRDGKFRK